MGIAPLPCWEIPRGRAKASPLLSPPTAHAIAIGAQASSVVIKGQRGTEEVAAAATKLQAIYRGDKVRKGGTEPAKPTGSFGGGGGLCARRYDPALPRLPRCHPVHTTGSTGLLTPNLPLRVWAGSLAAPRRVSRRRCDRAEQRAGRG